MAENEDVVGSPEQELPEQPIEQPTAQPVQPVLKTRWRDRAWSLKSMVAVALATFLIGGLVGGTVVGVAGHDHDQQRMHRMGPWGPGMRVPPGWRHRQFNDGQPQRPPGMMPYGVPTPTPPGAPAAPTPSPGATG